MGRDGAETGSLLLRALAPGRGREADERRRLHFRLAASGVLCRRDRRGGRREGLHAELPFELDRGHPVIAIIARADDNEAADLSIQGQIGVAHVAVYIESLPRMQHNMGVIIF